MFIVANCESGKNAVEINSLKKDRFVQKYKA